MFCTMDNFWESPTGLSNFIQARRKQCQIPLLLLGKKSTKNCWIIHCFNRFPLYLSIFSPPISLSAISAFNFFHSTLSLPSTNHICSVSWALLSVNIYSMNLGPLFHGRRRSPPSDSGGARRRLVSDSTPSVLCWKTLQGRDWWSTCCKSRSKFIIISAI